MTNQIFISSDLIDDFDDLEPSLVSLSYEFKGNQIFFTLSRSDGFDFYEPKNSRDLLEIELNRAFSLILRRIDGY